MNGPTLLVLAAGAGNRYGGLKQIDSIGPSGETIIDYSIYDALRAGFEKIVFVIRKDIEDVFRTNIGNRFQTQIPVSYAFQEIDRLPGGLVSPAGRTKPWGTVQAVIAAVGLIHEPFAVINADDFYGADSFQLLAGHLKSESTAYAMVGFTLRNTLSANGPVARGICDVRPNGNLASIVELTNIVSDGSAIRSTASDGHTTVLKGDEVVSMNLWGLTPLIFPEFVREFESFLAAHGSDRDAECYLPSAIQNLIAAKRAVVNVLPTTASWFGVTYRADRPTVIDSIGRLIEKGVYPEKLWQ